MTEIDIRWQLRQLPREVEASRDLWPDIANAIERASPRSRRIKFVPIALAASLLLAAGLAWNHRIDTDRSVETDIAGTVVAREAHAVTYEYQAALHQFSDAPLAAEYTPSLQLLDRDLARIHSAIAANPDSLYLLEQLHKTYSRRLALTQRAAYG